MLFNSNEFLLFFAAFWLAHYLTRNSIGARNGLIVLASYAFYAWWDWRFVFLLFLTSLTDYVVGIMIHRAQDQRTRKRWLAFSVTTNLGVLATFKYCGFFVDSFIAALARLGLHLQPRTWEIILPVGISFYTFQSLSYTIDVYRARIQPTTDLVRFLAYVAFFPQLVAGPIERASNLLFQLSQTRIISHQNLVDGVWLVIWGMFQKVVVADNLAPLVEMVYQKPIDSAPAVALATIAFSFQILADFAGYSDVARGLAKILGFELMENFNLPYLAVNLREFWRRWHISLSTWLRDYLYISLGGNRLGPGRTVLNLVITMVLGGLWHGAAWHFVVWGLWHGLGLAVHRIWRQYRPSPSNTPIHRAASHIATISFVMYGWMLFRANSLHDAFTLSKALLTFSTPTWLGSYALNLTIYTLPVILMTLWQAHDNDNLAPTKINPWARVTLQGILLWLTAFHWRSNATPFIYFQF